MPSLNLSEGKRYRTANGQPAKVLAETCNGHFVGTIGFPERACLWTRSGAANNSSDDLVAEVIPGATEWAALRHVEREGLVAMVKAMPGQKINAIKFIRGAIGIGLLEAKNIVEGIENRTFFV